MHNFRPKMSKQRETALNDTITPDFSRVGIAIAQKNSCDFGSLVCWSNVTGVIHLDINFHWKRKQLGFWKDFYVKTRFSPICKYLVTYLFWRLDFMLNGAIFPRFFHFLKSKHHVSPNVYIQGGLCTFIVYEQPLNDNQTFYILWCWSPSI